MKLEFEIKLTAKDLYRFNMRNAYTSMQGILSIVFAALVMFVFVWKFDTLSTPYKILFIALAILFLVYIPVSLWLRSKQISAKSDVFKEPLKFIFGDEIIRVETTAGDDEDSAEFGYSEIFKVVRNKNYILIYTNRVSAYIIPRRLIVNEEESLTSILRDKVDDFKLRGLKG